VYTVSQEKGAVYREDRHLDANFNRHDFVKNLRKRFGEDCCFDEIILDYFWIPQGWDASHWSKSFFEKTLVSFAAENMLREGTGAVYLPFCLHCFKSVHLVFHKLKQYFNVSFIRKNELTKVSLWKGTQGIDPFNMQHFLGKKLNQEDIYCTFGPKDVAEAMEDPGVSKSVLIKLARSLEDFHSIRFICLTLLPGKRPALTNHTFGSFIGCIAPSKVERGFYQMEVDSFKTMKAGTNIFNCLPAQRTTIVTKTQTARVRRCLFPAEERGDTALISESSNSEKSIESTVATSLRNGKARESRAKNTPNLITISESLRARKRGRPPKNDMASSKSSSIGSPSVRDNFIALKVPNHRYNTRKKTSCVKPAPAIVTPVGIATPDAPGSPISIGNKRNRSQSQTQVQLAPQVLFPSFFIANTFDTMPRHYFDVKSQGEAGSSPKPDVASNLSPNQADGNVFDDTPGAEFGRIYPL
jgi:hypothetical protein